MMFMNLFCTLKKKFLQNFDSPLAATYNGDSSSCCKVAAAGCPPAADAQTFHGKRWEDIRTWTAAIKLGRTANEALECAVGLLRGEAKLAFLIEKKRGGDFGCWKKFLEWAIEKFEKALVLRKTDFFGFVANEKRQEMALTDFVATAFELSIEAEIEEVSTVRAIVSSLPLSLRRLPDVEKISTSEELLKAINVLSGQGKLAWEKKPLFKRNNPPKRTCYHCGKGGHVASNCRAKKKEQKDNKVNALLCRASGSHPLRVEGEINGRP
ncbi:MAG: uncharacterized protein A8A55_3407, partial [Amphiamblys sp. WSBS2006]